MRDLFCFSLLEWQESFYFSLPYRDKFKGVEALTYLKKRKGDSFLPKKGIELSLALLYN